LIVIGRFQNILVKKKNRHLHFDGTITPAEVLFGPQLAGQKLRYHFVCTCCRPSPDLEIFTRKDDIWFFNKATEGYWTSAGSSCADPGYRPIDQRNEMAEYLKTYRNTAH
jgi:hypothetical protein